MGIVDPKGDKAFMKALDDSKIQYKLEETDAFEAMVKKQMTPKTSSRDPKDFNYYSYHTLEEVNTRLDFIAQTRMGTAWIARTFSIGRSFEGRDIKAIKVSRERPVGDTRNTVIIECGIHAREWTSVAYCLWLSHHLMSSPERIELTNYDFVIIPVLNPDGYVFKYIDYK